MGANTKISWTDHTFNPWRGCTKISPGCAHCYADAQSVRNPAVLGTWGPNGTRVVASEAMWREPLVWDKAAFIARRQREHDSLANTPPDAVPAMPPSISRPRVFCASMADVFEDWQGQITDPKGRIAHTWPDGYWTFLTPEEAKSPPFVPGQRSNGLMARPITLSDVRRRLFALIDRTPNLDWLLLTKRPENIPNMLPACKQCETVGRVSSDCTHCHGAGRCLTTRRVWLGVSVEDQATDEQRIPHLLRVPAAVRFLSCEPLLGPIDLRRYLGERWECPECGDDDEGGKWLVAGRHRYCGNCAGDNGRDIAVRKKGPMINLVIVGGESGPNARPMDPAWARSIRDQCREYGTPFFFKQAGGRGRDKGGHLLDGEVIQQWPAAR